MSTRLKPKPAPKKDHLVMVRLSRAQYEKLAQAAAVAGVPLATFCRALVLEGVQQNRLRGIPSKRSPSSSRRAAA